MATLDAQSESCWFNRQRREFPISASEILIDKSAFRPTKIDDYADYSHVCTQPDDSRTIFENEDNGIHGASEIQELHCRLMQFKLSTPSHSPGMPRIYNVAFKLRVERHFVAQEPVSTLEQPPQRLGLM